MLSEGKYSSNSPEIISKTSSRKTLNHCNFKKIVQIQQDQHCHNDLRQLRRWWLRFSGACNLERPPRGRSGVPLVRLDHGSMRSHLVTLQFQKKRAQQNLDVECF